MEEQSNKMPEDAFKIPEEALEKLHDPEYLHKQIEQGMTFQEILGYDEAQMEKFYGAAYDLFQEGRYQDAADGFVFLTTLNPYVHNFWLGLGMSEQLNEEYESAIVAYGMATMTDMESPVPHYHTAKCHYLMGDTDTALSFLNLAIELAADREPYTALKADAIATKARLEKRGQ